MKDERLDTLKKMRDEYEQDIWSCEDDSEREELVRKYAPVLRNLHKAISELERLADKEVDKTKES